MPYSRSGREMVQISVGVVAFLLLLFLSILSVIALSGSWAIVVPESVNWEMTRDGKRLLRARYVFTAACSLILTSLLLDVFVKNPARPLDLFWIWDTHPDVLVFLLVLSSALFTAASYHVFRSKGEGRWVLCIAAPCMAALSLIGTVWVGQLI